jgi:hypothetical protein
MSTGRLFRAGIAGGIAMYIWTSIAHLALPLSTAGIQEITNDEPALLAQMHSNLGEASGMYLFPSSGWKSGDSSEQRNAAMKRYSEKLATNPSGLLIYHPPGRKALTPGQLVTEFITELIEALLAVFLLGQTRLASYLARVGFITVIGILAALATNISYWNWYGFPGSYTAAYIVIEIIGFFVAGLAAAALLRKGALQPNPQVPSASVPAAQNR